MLNRAGAGTSLAAALLIGVGARCNYPELVVAGASCGLAVAVSLVAAIYRPRLVVRIDFGVHRVVENQSSDLYVTMFNSGILPYLALVLRMEVEKVPTIIPLGTVRRRSSLTVERKLPALRRGVYRIPYPQIRFRDPFGMARVVTRRALPIDLVVYPQTIAVKPLPGQGPTDLDGRPRLATLAGGDTFYSLRQYVAGDDLRKVHWASSARRGSLLVRHMTLPEETEHMVVLDIEESAYRGGRFDDAVRIAASLCLASGRAGESLTLVTALGRARDEGVRSAETSAAQLLLAQVRTAPSGNIARVTVPEGACVAVISGRPGPDLLDWLNGVRHGSVGRYLVQVLDAAQEPVVAPSGVRSMPVGDLAEFGAVWSRWNQA